MATILCHRGMWAMPHERNSLTAIEAAFQHGFGVETDIRDCRGELVVSHDPPSGGEIPFTRVLEARAKSSGPLALNIKADGLHEPIATALATAGEPEYFVFDMSIPDTLSYRRAGLRYFSRQSEYEPTPALYDEAAGVWLDSFDSGWFERDVIAAHLTAGKQVCIVSPELHGRDREGDWERWSAWEEFRSPDVLICTDVPVDAQELFATS